MRRVVPLALSGVVAAQAGAAELTVSVEIPRLNVAEYHRPYVALWLEHKDAGAVGTLAVWYDLKLKDREGEKWLKDLRQWWRRIGRDLALPVDGVTAATRAPGTHKLVFAADRAPLAGLAPGSYELVIEAAREVGGRELLRIPFDWPAAAPSTAAASGEHELGAVSLTVQP